MMNLILLLTHQENCEKLILNCFPNSYHFEIMPIHNISSNLLDMDLSNCACLVIDVSFYQVNKLISLIRILRNKYHNLKIIMFTNDFQIVNKFLFYYPIYFCQWDNPKQYHNVFANIISNSPFVSKYFYYHSKNLDKCIDIKEILYFEKRKHKVFLKFVNQNSDEFNGNLLEIKNLNYPHFLEINRSVIINALYINRIDEINIILTNNEHFEISRRRKKSLYKKLEEIFYFE